MTAFGQTCNACIAKNKLRRRFHCDCSPETAMKSLLTIAMLSAAGAEPFRLSGHTPKQRAHSITGTGGNQFFLSLLRLFAATPNT